MSTATRPCSLIIYSILIFYSIRPAPQDPQWRSPCLNQHAAHSIYVLPSRLRLTATRPGNGWSPDFHPWPGGWVSRQGCLQHGLEIQLRGRLHLAIGGEEHLGGNGFLVDWSRFLSEVLLHPGSFNIPTSLSLSLSLSRSLFLSSFRGGVLFLSREDAQLSGAIAPLECGH